MKWIAVAAAAVSLSVPLAAPLAGAGAAVMPFAIAITTAYATSDPFPNRLDQAFAGEDTGYFLIANEGAAAFSGTIATVAVSAFAGDLSLRPSPVVLPSGAAVSIAIPFDASNVGGFNGPAYDFRPGVIIVLSGTLSLGGLSSSAVLAVADRDIHSGVFRTDPAGLVTDNFVLQGGDPWGFDTGDAFELSQAWGRYLFTDAPVELALDLPEAGAIWVLVLGWSLLAGIRTRRWARRCAVPGSWPGGAPIDGLSTAWLRMGLGFSISRGSHGTPA